MPTTFDRVDLACPNTDPTQWPKLSCGAASQLALHDSSLRLEVDRELLFQDGGQIRSFDDTHKLVFDRPSNLLELHELGSIRFLTGGPTPSEKVRIGADGRVGIGTETPEAMLHIAGDLRIDDSVGVMGAATVSGDLRVSGTANVRSNLQVEGNVGIGTSNPQANLHVAQDIRADGSLLLGGDLNVAGTIRGKLADVGVTVATGLQEGQSIPVPTGFSRSECIFYAALKYVLIEPDLQRHPVLCTVDANGKINISPDGHGVAMGLAIAKKGGW
jgi:cytoskeletal protein CcmA (bactofilin family)